MSFLDLLIKGSLLFIFSVMNYEIILENLVAFWKINILISSLLNVPIVIVTDLMIV